MKNVQKNKKRILVANRGEIAVRIIRSIRELGYESVAIYSDADKHSLHVSLADYSVNLPGEIASETYLDSALLIEICKRFSVDAVHPGYGFLSENPDFAEDLANNGIKLIGPKAQSIRFMGDKITAKKLMGAQGIPVVPGSVVPTNTYEEILNDAKKIGFPVMVKAAAGGGGRGMRVVFSEQDLEEAFTSCRREAQAYFGNPQVFCEKYITEPRHIEIQVMFDSMGHGVYLFERDCSIQRRNQKLIEEAPSTYLNDEQRKIMGELAVKAGMAVDYEGAGTVEFICNAPGEYYFMEMNTRIQVEHPVTEMITGVDLVAEQIKVAFGEPLSFSQDEVMIHGWAVEARINAENPRAGFSPDAGKINYVHFPQGPFVRIDTHIYAGYEIPKFYDSLLAKVIAWGRTRDEALKRLKSVLSEFQILGIHTTTSFHEWLISHPKFRAGTFTTRFLEENETDLAAYFAGESVESSEMDMSSPLSMGIVLEHLT